MKICTIFTGGTIGSVLDDTGYIGPREGTPYRLLELYQKEYGEDVKFETSEPYRILSENLSAHYLLKLLDAIRQVLDNGGVDGIIVTHGTDTLQYGAAVLGYVFGAAKIPIVVVSSHYVLDDERANGLTNFRYAVEFIKGQYGKDVFVSYCNTGELPTIHRATRLQPLIPCSDYVSSVQDAWYGKFENSHFILNDEYDVKGGQATMLDFFESIQLSECSEAISWIRPYVGMQYPVLTDKVKVVLHGSYHSGTVCVDGPLKDFMQRAKERNISVFLTGLLTGVNAYETVKEYETLGITVLPTSAEVAQYCKLWLAVSNGLDVRQIMKQSMSEDWI
jgi:L-asparaginase